MNYIRHSFDREDAIKTHFSCFSFSVTRDKAPGKSVSRSGRKDLHNVHAAPARKVATIRSDPRERKQERVRETRNRAAKKGSLRLEGFERKLGGSIIIRTKTPRTLRPVIKLFLRPREPDRCETFALTTAAISDRSRRRDTGTGTINQKSGTVLAISQCIGCIREGCNRLKRFHGRSRSPSINFVCMTSAIDVLIGKG